ncbi:hypothetical protein [Croceicoccus sediminis]|uniref:hypothetical protein n=1 Tax=Croceicoccus sediminis TaxID=2571150 RepID=UPI001182A9A5|nr:hypothetical protein [Croceicoccus sediminis]
MTDSNTITNTDPQLRDMDADTDVQYPIREAVALFPTEKSLEEAIVRLQEQGVDRSRISVLGHLPSAADADGARNWMHHLTNLDAAPRGNPGEDEVMPEAKAAVIGLPGYGGAMAGLVAVMASGGTLGIAIASAILVGAVGGGGGYIVSRMIERSHHDQIATQLEAGGLVVWVKLQDDDRQVLDMLEQLGGKNAHVSEHDGHWGSADIPLAKAQPDALL